MFHYIFVIACDNYQEFYIERHMHLDSMQEAQSEARQMACALGSEAGPTKVTYYEARRPERPSYEQYPMF